MKKVRAKFFVGSNEVNSEGNHNITLHAVTSGSEENASFFKYTPGGTISLSVVNAETAAPFEKGKEVYVDFTIVE